MVFRAGFFGHCPADCHQPAGSAGESTMTPELADLWARRAGARDGGIGSPASDTVAHAALWRGL